MYKIIDNHGGGLKEDEVHETLDSVKESLKQFHSIDNNVENWSLIDCLEIGCWSVTNMEGVEIDYNNIR